MQQLEKEAVVTVRESPPQRGVSALLLLLLLELLSALDNYFTRDPKLHTGWPYFMIVSWNHPGVNTRMGNYIYLKSECLKTRVKYVKIEIQIKGNPNFSSSSWQPPKFLSI